MSVTAVILSAGASSRMGRPKALLEREGVTSLARIATAARSGGAVAVAVVLGPPDGDRIKARLPVGTSMIWNPNPARGMLSSVQAGIANLPWRTTAALLWPVDHPLVSVETVTRILTQSSGRIVVPRFGGRGGHPVRIPRQHFGAILSLADDASLADYIRQQGEAVLLLDVEDAGILADLDTPEDVERAFAPVPAVEAVEAVAAVAAIETSPAVEASPAAEAPPDLEAAPAAPSTGAPPGDAPPAASLSVDPGPPTI